jgi:hypothetical protein
MFPEDKVKETLHQFSSVTTPVVTEILGIARRSVAEALGALQKAESSVGDIANAAVNVASAHADLLASSLKSNGPKQ